MLKRALAIHDISCIGRCSLTVALPIISACGVECSVLPTCVLSTHTGGFTGFTFRDLTDDIEPISRHWQSLGEKFDAIYTGFLGTKTQINLVTDIIKTFRTKDNIILVDPVMADHGKLYSIFDMAYVEEMKTLVKAADVIAPNITEACLLTGTEYREGPYEKGYIEDLLNKFSVFGGGCDGGESSGSPTGGAKKIVLKGITFDDKKIGAAVYADGAIEYILGEKLDGVYHGTGDIFGSMLLSALLNGHNLTQSARFAVDYIIDSIKQSKNPKASKYGVDFEVPLAEYGIKLRREV